MNASNGWWNCPRCGLPNINERRICKRCRFSYYLSPVSNNTLVNEPVSVADVATEDTATLFTSPNRQHLLMITPSYLEYSCPERALRSNWLNLVAIQNDGTEQVLRLRAPCVFRHIPSGDNAVDLWLAQIIPVWRFGYATNPELQRLLKQFAPQLRQK